MLFVVSRFVDSECTIPPLVHELVADRGLVSCFWDVEDDVCVVTFFLIE